MKYDLLNKPTPRADLFHQQIDIETCIDNASACATVFPKLSFSDGYNEAIAHGLKKLLDLGPMAIEPGSYFMQLANHNKMMQMDKHRLAKKGEADYYGGLAKGYSAILKNHSLISGEYTRGSIEALIIRASAGMLVVPSEYAHA